MFFFCKKRTHALPETKIDGWKTIFLGPFTIIFAKMFVYQRVMSKVKTKLTGLEMVGLKKLSWRRMNF